MVWVDFEPEKFCVIGMGCPGKGEYKDLPVLSIRYWTLWLQAKRCLWLTSVVTALFLAPCFT